MDDNKNYEINDGRAVCKYCDYWVPEGMEYMMVEHHKEQCKEDK